MSAGDVTHGVTDDDLDRELTRAELAAGIDTTGGASGARARRRICTLEDHEGILLSSKVHPLRDDGGELVIDTPMDRIGIEVDQYTAALLSNAVGKRVRLHRLIEILG